MVIKAATGSSPLTSFSTETEFSALRRDFLPLLYYGRILFCLFSHFQSFRYHFGALPKNLLTVSRFRPCFFLNPLVIKGLGKNRALTSDYSSLQ